MNAQEFMDKHMEAGEVFDAKEVHCGAPVINHKSVYQTSVWQVGEQYFEVTNRQDNTDYWSDGESYEPDVCEVTPVKKVVEITEWEVV